MLHSALLAAGPKNSTIFNRRIDRSQCFGGHHVSKTATRTSLLYYKHEAFQKVKCKLDLIEQQYLDKIYFR